MTVSITALANAHADKLTEDEFNLLGVALTQLGDMLVTLAKQRSICSIQMNLNQKTVTSASGINVEMCGTPISRIP